jgi:hypothetical protein
MKRKYLSITLKEGGSSWSHLFLEKKENLYVNRLEFSFCTIFIIIIYPLQQKRPFYGACPSRADVGEIHLDESMKGPVLAPVSFDNG